MKQTLLDWLGSFWKVMLIPTPQTFQQEAKKAQGKFASALGWLIFYAIYLVVIASILWQSLVSVPAILAVLILLPLGVVLFTSVLNFVCQRIFHSKGYIYDQLFYITVAIFLPISVIFTPLAAVIAPEIFRVLIFILLLYQSALLTVAIKVISKLEYWQVLVALVLSIIAGILAGFVIFILIISTISPPGINQK